jgi:serine/threonine protein kinase
MTQKYTQLIGGLYRVGQILSAGPVVTNCTAYDRNTNDVVGLFIIELPPQLPHTIIHQHLQVLERRRTLQSPHVIRIYRWGIEENRVYVATDRPHGVSLQYVLDHEDIDIKRAIDLTRQLALGLGELHKHHIAGMDLRPQHITVDAIGLIDRVQIDDIGLRSLLYALGYSYSQHHDDIGYFNPRYTPPEYINNGPVGPWSDIYQLGLLLFTMITGRPPFVGRSEAETGILQSTSPVPRMTQYAHETPSTLQEVVNCAMSKEPPRRYSSIQHFLTALDQVKLPAPRSVNGQPQIPVADKELPPSVGLTREMTSIGEDTGTLSARPTDQEATLIDAAQSTNAYAYLCYEQAGAEKRRIPITQKSVIVGRTDPKRGVIPDIDLSQFDTKMTVSRQHARIRYEEKFFSIEDLKSRNKTRLKDEPLDPFKTELLQHGDVIYFGKVRMRFEVPGRE